MKSILYLIVLLGFTLTLQAQFSTKSGKVFYEVVDSSFKSKTKGQLYSMSKLWALDQFDDVKNSLEIDNPTEGLIAGRVSMTETIKFEQGVFICRFSFVIISKDGRYKAQLYNFQLTNAATMQQLSLDYVLAHPELFKDKQKTLVKYEAAANEMMRNIQWWMGEVYNVMEF